MFPSRLFSHNQDTIFPNWEQVNNNIFIGQSLHNRAKSSIAKSFLLTDVTKYIATTFAKGIPFGTGRGFEISINFGL